MLLTKVSHTHLYSLTDHGVKLLNLLDKLSNHFALRYVSY
jgi:hypothetical protein